MFKRRTIKPQAEDRLITLRKCLASDEAKRNARRLVRKLRKVHDEWVRITPYAGGGSHWAIPFYLVSCESGAGASVAERWRADNPTSAAEGPYQLLGHGQPFPVRTWAHKMAHHRIAYNLYITSGGGPWSQCGG